MNFSDAVGFMFIVQILHSVEEVWTGFHKRWYFRKLPRNLFIGFEIFHTAFWGAVLFVPGFPLYPHLAGLFFLLMFANGVQHLVWSLWEKRYVPGLVSAILHLFIVGGFVLSNVREWI